MVLRVSGRIPQRNVDTLRELLGREKAGMAIDLKDVTLVDREAVKLLALSETNGTELRNCPAYIREWVYRGEGVRDVRSCRTRAGKSEDIEVFNGVVTACEESSKTQPDLARRIWTASIPDQYGSAKSRAVQARSKPIAYLGFDWIQPEVPGRT